MKRLKILIALFCLAVSVPLAYVVYQTYVGLEQEEKAQMRFFAETMFDHMEDELAILVQAEEIRAVDEYGYFSAADNSIGGQSVSPLAVGDYEPYLYGYLQNNPDGSFQTPLIADMGLVPDNQKDKIAGIREVNRLFNEKKLTAAAPTGIPGLLAQSQDEKATEPEKAEIIDDDIKPAIRKSSISERYLKTPSDKTDSAEYLGKKKQRVEAITREQAFNIASEKEVRSLSRQRLDEALSAPSSVQSPAGIAGSASSQKMRRSKYDNETTVQESTESWEIDGSALQDHAVFPDQGAMVAEEIGEPQLQVEVAPFQSVIIDEEKVYIFRRISMSGQMYRQGFIILLEPLMKHLAENNFIDQPLSEFSALEMVTNTPGLKSRSYVAGAEVKDAGFAASRQFPEPFDFLVVSLKANEIPVSGARDSLNLAIFLLSLFMLLGLFVIYRSVHSIVALSEKRSEFVSSVTHELKTPLTNIRMYTEMLEQGVAPSPEKEQEYLGVLTRESGRLSNLITNVLELARLEKKTRKFNMQKNSIASVFAEVASTMSQNLKQEEFSLHIEDETTEDFVFDRDVLTQILMNLMENSIKFGRDSAEKRITLGARTQNDSVDITVSDTGPGIPQKDLSRIFDDFYRVDNSLTRATGGTGIGLALVKKFASAMGGRVSAANNDDGGCTISVSFPGAQ